MSRKRNTQTASAIVAFLTLGVFFAQQQGWLHTVSQTAEKAQPGLYSVDHFIDGDTIAVKMGDKIESVRLIGVDTPETHKPNTPVQCYGPAAASYTKNIIGNNHVRLATDSKSTNRDRYNRLLRYVYLPDGTMVESQLIKNGYGFAYTAFPITKSDEFVADQQQAKAAHKGLWGNCQPYQETNGRWQTEDAS